jgi:predicted ArsR family transcriptional regulator
MATDTPHGDDPARGLGPTRARVLALLQDAGDPMTAAAAAERLGLHPNGARFHLDALADEGLVARAPEQRGSRGRPRMLYGPAPAAPRAAHRSYRFLAQVLSSVISDALPDPAGSAEAAGEAWGRSLTPPGDGAEGPAGAVDALVASLDRVGFESRPVQDADGDRLEITHCPFLEVAAERQDVVCALHLGLLRGAAEQLGSALSVRSLDPLVEPSLCVARLAAPGQARNPTTSRSAARASGIGSNG